MGIPPFAQGRRWHRRASKSSKINRQVYHDRDDDYEYERDARGERVTWHQICWRHHLYRDLDPETGEPVAGSEGEWRLLQ